MLPSASAARLLEVQVAALEERFRRRESRLLAEAPAVIRLDGVGFSRLAKAGFEAPRDPRVHEALVEAAKTIVRRYGFYAAHVVSDEINIYALRPPLPYSGRVEKLVSITASIAGAEASTRLGVPVYFDSRIIALEDPCEASRYLWYRARVGYGNYAGSLAKALGLRPRPRSKLAELLGELEARGVEVSTDWRGVGTAVVWERYVKTAETPRGVVEAERRRLAGLPGIQGLEAMESMIRADYGC